jgi:hypothetical protein
MFQRMTGSSPAAKARSTSAAKYRADTPAIDDVNSPTRAAPLVNRLIVWVVIVPSTAKTI